MCSRAPRMSPFSNIPNQCSDVGCMASGGFCNGACLCIQNHVLLSGESLIQNMTSLNANTEESFAFYYIWLFCLCALILIFCFAYCSRCKPRHGYDRILEKDEPVEKV